jgi:hypothetical protein
MQAEQLPEVPSARRKKPTLHEEHKLKVAQVAQPVGQATHVELELTRKVSKEQVKQ